MKRLILLNMAVAITLAACQKSEEQTPDVDSSSEVVFTSAISTRATGTTWDAGDKIGVFMYETSSSTIYDSRSENVTYTTSGGESGSFTSSDPLLYPADGKVDFIAYHPYTTAYSDNVITLTTADQSSEAKVKAQDFMVASTQGYGENDTPSLSFTRKMSKIVINVNRKESKENVVLSDISFLSVITDGTFTLLNGVEERENASVAAGTTTSEISMFFNETSSTIEAIIVPQVFSSALTLLIDGVEFKTTISATFAEDTQYNYNIIIGTDAIEFTAGSIIGWTDEEESVEIPTTQV